MREREPPPARTAALVLTSAAGEILGALPALPVATPWWQDVAPVVTTFRERYDFEATVLRLLDSERPAPPGGRVTYLAEPDRPVPAAEPWSGLIENHPLRLAYARPGGPAADLAWAKSRMTEWGLALTAAPVQIRTWNLSSIWRLPIAAGSVWLKVVPPFFAHEGAILVRLAGAPVPGLLAHEGGRMLLAETPGEDLYGAGRDLQRRMIDLLLDLQTNHLGRLDDLFASGLPDWRAEPLTVRITEVAERRAAELDPARLRAFVKTLPGRMAALADCGPGDTLVHGDFHPGNFRGGADSLILHDWGDCGVGHPLLDQSAFLSAISAAERDPARRHWRRKWLDVAPGMDFERSERLVAPVSAARRAMVYQDFLDAIEPSEHPYHAADPVFWLSHALDLADRHEL
jgi:hypothetical protein